MNDDQAALYEFGGVARLFPLPGLVFFPHAMQPLHIFEPRYRQMTADALAGDRLVALVLLRPGWEDAYEEQPAIHSIGCLGRIVAEQLLADGRYNFALRGLARIRILAELETDRPYRQARVDILHDLLPDNIDVLMAQRSQLADLILPRVNHEPSRKQLLGLFKGEMPLAQLLDVLTFALPLPPEAKQQVLETLDVIKRAEQLSAVFRAVVADSAKHLGSGLGKRFPPDFSPN